HHNAQQPGRELGAPFEITEVRERFTKCALYMIFGIERVSEHRKGGPKRERSIAPGQFPKRLPVRLADHHQFLICSVAIDPIFYLSARLRIHIVKPPMRHSKPVDDPEFDDWESRFTPAANSARTLHYNENDLRDPEKYGASIRQLLSGYDIGTKLRRLRLRKKIGLVDLGKHTGLSASLLSQLE